MVSLIAHLWQRGAKSNKKPLLPKATIAASEGACVFLEYRRESHWLIADGRLPGGFPMAGHDLTPREHLRVSALAAAAAPFTGFSKWAFAFGHGSRGVEQIRPAQYGPQFFSEREYAVVERLAELI